MKNTLVQTTHVLSLLLSLLLAAAKAQTPAPSFEWVVYPESDGSSSGRSITIDNEGYIYSVGFFSDTMTFNGNLVEEAEGLYFTKMNSDGEIIWMNTITNSPLSEDVKIIADVEDNIFMVGYFSEQLDLTDTLLTTESYYVPWPPDYTAYKIDMFIAKFNSDGDFLWARQISNPDPMEEYLGVFTNHFSITTDALGNLLLQGSYDSYIVFQPDYTFPVTDYTNYLLKISPEGELLWNSLNPQILIRDISCDNDNNIYTTGMMQNTSGTDTLFFANDTITEKGILLKYNSEGEEIWAKVLPGGNRVGQRLSFDKNLYLYINSHIGDTSYFDIYTFLPGEYWLSKNDLNGNFLMHSKSLPCTNIVASYSGVFGCGGTYDTIFFNYDTIVSINNSPDLFVFKVDSHGNQKWIKSAGGDGTDSGNDLVINNEGEVFFTGRFQNEINFCGNTINTGNITSFICKIDTVLVTKTNLLLYKDKILIYPNPTKNYINIEFETQLTGNINFYNLTGKKVNTTSISEENKKTINISELKSGMYFLEIINKNTNKNTIYKIIKN